jgi:molybdopterin/thiamine biosynthesis adenylyltransferase
VRTYRAAEYGPFPEGEGPHARHQLLGGFSQAALETTSIGLIGAGGVNGQVGEGLARKGVGHLVIMDGDTVDPSNLNRQPFVKSQIGKFKAHALAERIVSIATARTSVIALPWYFPDLRAISALRACRVVVCGVDSDEARVAVATWAKAEGLALIVMAVTYNADFGYCFVQEPVGACFGCLDPRAFQEPQTTPCVVGSSIDILKVVGGLALYAIDSLLMDRPRSWNYKEVSLDGDRAERQLRVPKSDDCPLCGAKRSIERAL